MRKLQAQGVHHITLVGADRQTSIDFWEGVLGMPFVFEQPNLDNASESHLYFDPGDGRLITVFTDDQRRPDPARTSTDIGAVHHLAFAVSHATFQQAALRLEERGIRHSGVKDRGFMDFDLLHRPSGSADRALFLPFRAAGRLQPRRRPAGGAPDPDRTRRSQHCRDPPRRCDRAPDLPPREPVGRPRAEEPVLSGGPISARALWAGRGRACRATGSAASPAARSACRGRTRRRSRSSSPGG